MPAARPAHGTNTTDAFEDFALPTLTMADASIVACRSQPTPVLASIRSAFFEHPFTAVPWLCVYLSHVALATSCTRFCSGTCLSGHIFKYGTRPMAINVALALEPRQVGRFRRGLIISRRCCDEVIGLSWRYNNAFINTHCCKILRQV